MHTAPLVDRISQHALLRGGLGLGRAWSRGGVPGPWGALSRGCLLPGGVVSQHALRQTPHTPAPPHVDRMTDTCKKHNLRKLRLRAVTNSVGISKHSRIQLLVKKHGLRSQWLYHIKSVHEWKETRASKNDGLMAYLRLHFRIVELSSEYIGACALTDTDTQTDKNGLCRIVWRCLYSSDIESVGNSIGFSTHVIGICIGLGV